MADDTVDQERPRKNDMLKMYYGMNDDSVPSGSSNPLDIDSSNFNAELYLRRLKQVSYKCNVILKKCSVVIFCFAKF